MIPLHDQNPTRSAAVITVALILLNVGIYFFVQGPAKGTPQVPNGELRFALEHAAIPCELRQGEPLSIEQAVRTFVGGDNNACDARFAPEPQLFPDKNVWLSVLTSMFLHGDLLHIGFNMLFLWVFGNNIEDRFGRGAFLLFYLASGLVATLAHVAVQPDSTVPVVGASGAIAGVMGAYFVLYPRARITTLVFMLFVFFVQIEARWLLLAWFVSQFFINPNEGIAWAAHVGGFVFGVAVGLAARGRAKPAPWPPPRFPYPYA